MKKSDKKMYTDDGQDRLLPKFSLFIFDRSRIAAIIWLCLTIFGVLSYTTFLKREGFPSIDIPYSIATGSYLVNDAQQVDEKVTKPLSELILKDDRVKSVQATAKPMFYTVAVQYNEGVDAEKAGDELQARIEKAAILPAQASIDFETPAIGFTMRGDDAVITVYAKEAGATVEQLNAEAEKVVSYIKDQNISSIESISVIDPFVEGTDLVSGQKVLSQEVFDRFGTRTNDQTTFYDSVAIGIAQKEGTDVIQLDDKLKEVLAAYNAEQSDAAYNTLVSASYAHDIKDQVGELQRALLEGLLAVLVIGSIVIAIRASIITVIAMVTVLAITLGVLFVVGYSLNTITLFSLILCLGLIVDDTIIMVEALDAQRRRSKNARDTVKVATRKVSRAMVAATLTAVLSFAPLLFIGGILGGFIRAIPVTVITSLLVSLLVALIFIPLFARYLLLGKKQLGPKNIHEPAAGVEAKIAAFIGKPMLWARHSKKRLFSVGIVAVIVGFGFVGAGGALFQQVTFNIFPASKDTNGLTTTLTFPAGTTIQQAETVADKADTVIADTLGDNFAQASYFANTSTQTAMLSISITPYQERDVRSPELVTKLEKAFQGFEGAKVAVGQQDVAPAASSLSMQIQTSDREAGMRLAKDLNNFLFNRELTRASGEKAKIIETSISDYDTYNRTDGKAYVEVVAGFDADDTTTLVALTKDVVTKEFTEAKVASYGLEKDALQFSAGQEDENQESFNSLALAFPVLLFAIYILLAIQFRSLAQPLLIFMALPFSLFGITLGLYLTDNAFSFFAMLGFFALIGLSIKNTILLTDYANQLRRTGMPAVDAAVGALGERFRPLIATSFTAVVSLIPLAISSPFWEGLAVVLIFGLISSTFLVITVFPYYYLGAEYLRQHISRSVCLLWLALTIGLSVLAGMAGMAAFAPLIAVAVAVIQAMIIRRRRAAA